MTIKNIRIKIIITALILCAFVAVCDKASAQDNSRKTIDDLLEHFSRYFSVSERSEMWFFIIGAIDGCYVRLNGYSIEIYKFDKNDPGQRAILENIQKTNTLNVLGMIHPVLINGSFIITSYTGHPEREKINRIFQEF